MITSKPSSTLIPLALVGYGSMGKELERLAPQYGCDVRQIFSTKRPLQSATAEELNFDVAIDFSLPSAVLDNTRFLAEHGKSIILGTTGWRQHQTEVERIVQANDIALIWGTNFSVGVQMFNRIVKAAAELVSAFDDYDVALHELHHTRKVDSPSGTAHTLAAVIQSAIPRKTSLLADTAHTRIASEALHVSSTRVGETPGTHTVFLDSLADTIELTHRARNRSGFAIGALRAASWIQGRTGMVEFSEMFFEKFAME